MKKRLSLIISLCVLTLSIFIKISDFDIVEQLQFRVFDSFQIRSPRHYTPQPVKIIDIDDASLERLGQWPWPRNKLAAVIDRLTEAGVAAIATDIVFAEEDRTSPKNILPIWNQEQQLSYLLKDLPDHDRLFAEAIQDSNVVSGFVLTNDKNNKKAAVKAGFSYAGNDPKPYLPSFNGAVISLPSIEAAAKGNGALNSIADKDGILRRMPIIFLQGDSFYPTLSAEALRIAQGASSYTIKSSGANGEESFGDNTGITAIKIGNYQIPTDANGKFWIYYTDYVPDRYVPIWKILDPKFDLSFLAGDIIFIGTSAAGLRDIRATPLNQTTSGVEIHAQAIEQILTGEFLKRPDWISGAEIIFMTFVGFVVIAIMANFSALWGALFTVAALAGAVSFSWFSFIHYRVLIDPVTPGIAIILIYLSESLIRYISSEKEKKQVRDAFSHYMSPALVAQLAANPEKLQLGGETKNLTFLFCDIRGFTTISESFNAHDLTKFINNFLTPMTTVILGNKGTIDKYMGDCIMAFWNAPLDDPEHSRNGCISALQMIASLKELNEKQEREAKENGRKFIPINIGVGLNTGDACVGNMGSDQRFDYSVLGDDVNLASRLEGQSKNYGVNIVIGENTRQSVKDFATMELDLIQVKGKTKPVRIYTLLGDVQLANDNNFQTLSAVFLKMLTEYRARNWQKANNYLKEGREIFENSLEKLHIEGLFDLYEERIKTFKKNPPPEGWDGSYVATSK